MDIRASGLAYSIGVPGLAYEYTSTQARIQVYGHPSITTGTGASRVTYGYMSICSHGLAYRYMWI